MTFLFRRDTFDHAIVQAVWESNEYRLPDQFAADDIIIDIGAHIGTFSFACLSRGAGKVIAFEPERSNFGYLSKNLATFGKAVELYCMAVWRSDQAENMTLFYNPNEDPANTGGGQVSAVSGIQQVTGVGLDHILNKISRPIRLLKLDCEGSEFPVLLTSKRLDCVQSICGEYHEAVARSHGRRHYTAGMLEEYLRSVGFDAVFSRSAIYQNVQLGHFFAERRSALQD
jgi:FkbM family methyltransferase